MFSRRSRSASGPSGLGHFLAPLLIGVVYGLARYLPGDFTLDFIYWQSPFFFTTLGGIAIAFACRPVLSRIPWSRLTAMMLGVLLLICLGEPADWGAGALMEQFGLGGIPVTLPTVGWPLLWSALAAGLLMGLLFRAGSEGFGRSDLMGRMSHAGLMHYLTRPAAVAVVAVCVVLLAGWIDARWEDGSSALYLPLVEPNPWLRLEGIWFREQPPSGTGGVVGYLAVLWVRWLTAALALLPIALTLRGSRGQLTLVFGLLIFVIGDFAPLMVDQPYPSLVWLLERVTLGLVRAFAIGLACAMLMGLPPRPAEVLVIGGGK